MSLTLEELNVIINQSVKDTALKAAILKDAAELEAEKKAERQADKEDGPKAKNKHVFFVRKDEAGNFSQAGYIAKVSADSDNSTLLTRIQTASAQQNNGGKSGAGKRGRKSKFGKIEKYSEFFPHAKRKFTKEVDIQPLKDLVEVIILPTEEIKFD